MGSVVRDCRCKRIAVHSSAVCLRPIQQRRCQETSDLPACNLEMYKYVKYGCLLGHRFPHSDVSSVAAKPACLPQLPRFYPCTKTGSEIGLITAYE